MWKGFLSDPGDGPVQVKDWETRTFYCPQDLVFIFFFSLLCFSYNDGVGRDSLFQKLPDDRNQIQMSFQARDAAGRHRVNFPFSSG